MSTKTGVTLTAAALTDNSGGTASGTLAAITSTYDEAVLSNTVADLAAQIEAITIDLTSIKTSLDSSHARITT